MPAPKKTAKAEPKADQQREVIYPQFVTFHRFAGSEQGPLTWAEMRAILGWETEEDYVRRMMALHPGTKEKQWAYGEDFLLLDTDGRKVRCHRNVANRPYDDVLSRTYTQDMLNRMWAGPTCFPGETVNGEPIILGKYGDARSVQHRGTAFCRACEIWHKDAPGGRWKTLWPTEPVLDCVINAGVSDDPRVVRTIDSGKPRSEADMLYTTTFARDAKAAKGCTDKDRVRMARATARANDLLWKRTAAATEHEQYATHSVQQEFLDRHPRLVKAVQHLLAQDRDDGISCHGVSTGQCAALLYLMGCSASDGAKYKAAPVPGDGDLDWKLWADAERFWTLLADGGEKLPPLLGSMPDPKKKTAASGIYAAKGPALGDKGGNTRILLSRRGHPESSNDEKTGVIIKAWNIYASRPEEVRKDLPKEVKWCKDNITGRAVSPEYGGIEETAEDGITGYKLAEFPNCGEWTIVDGQTPKGTGGIDLGGRPPKQGEEDDAPDPKEVEQAKEQAKEDRLRQIKEAAERAKAKTAEDPTTKPLDKGAKDKLEELRTKHAGKILLIESKDGGRNSCFGTDAETVAELTSGKAVKNANGVLEFGFASEQRDRFLAKLHAAGHKVATVRQIKGVATVFNEVAKK